MTLVEESDRSSVEGNENIKHESKDVPELKMLICEPRCAHYFRSPNRP